jgi:dihydrodipicolinate synthase/N-acetylneuraminate lyase
MRGLRPEGGIVPLATPLIDDERLDGLALDSLIDRLLPDVDGVFVLGSSGEFALLEDTMRAELINRTVERVEGRHPVYAAWVTPGRAARSPTRAELVASASTPSSSAAPSTTR